MPAPTGAARFGLGPPTAGGVVLVGSTNPAKVGAVRAAVARLWPAAAPAVRVEGVAGVPSGVADQPVGDDETLAGALNRVEALRARAARGGSGVGGPRGGSSSAGGIPSPGGVPWLFVAIEGGVVWRPAVAAGPPAASSPRGGGPAAARRDLYCMAWAVVAPAQSGCVSRARSAEFLLPPALAELVEGGMELGCADDKVFGRVGSGRGSGTIGKLSGGLVTRADYYAHAVEMALLPFLNPGLYPHIAGGRAED